MTASVWIGMGSLAITLVLAICAAALTFGRLMANVQNLAAVVDRLVAESRVEGNSLVEMRALVASLRETVSGLQETLRKGFSERLLNIERRLDLLEDQHKRNHQ